MKNNRVPLSIGKDVNSPNDSDEIGTPPTDCLTVNNTFHLENLDIGEGNHGIQLEIQATPDFKGQVFKIASSNRNI